MGGRYGAWEAGEWTPEAALALTTPTDDFLCPLSANTYGLDFKEFEIKDYDRGISLFHVARPADAPAVDYQVRAAQSGRLCLCVACGVLWFPQRCGGSSGRQGVAGH